MTDDLISRRDAIDELTKFFCDNDVILGDFPNCERNERKATVLMENVRSIDAEPQWIPCSKRLPDESDAYLVTNCNCVCPVELAVFKADGAYWTDAYAGERYKNGYILAWMPLPERYEVEE